MRFGLSEKASRTMRRSTILTWPFRAGFLTLLAVSIIALVPTGAQAQVSSPEAGPTSYVDPEDRFAIPIPTNWVAEEEDGFVRIVTNDQKIAVFMVVLPESSATRAVEQALRLVEANLDPLPEPGSLATPAAGNDDFVLLTLDDGAASGQLVQALAQRIGSDVYVLILDGELEAVKLRQVQVDKILQGTLIRVESTVSPVATPGA